MLTLMLTAVLASETPAATEIKQPHTGTLEFDSRLPAEIQVDGQTAAQLYTGGKFSMEAPAGSHQITVVTNGRARQLTVDVSRTATAVVFVGRNGLTATARLEPLPEVEGVTPLQLRVVGSEEVLVQVYGKRHRIPPGGTLDLQIPLGRHEMALKNSSGTVLWARGHLELTRTNPVVIQITEGRMPEVSGVGSTFVAGS